MIYLKEGQTPLNLAYNDEIVHEANSKYQLSFKYPTNNPLWEDLVEETLLLADDLHGEQEFIIFEVEKHHGYITVYANQVATLLNNYSITELSVNNASGDRVMRSLVSSIIREHKFTFSSDIANTHSLNLKNVTVANALFKDKHSILGQWGGDLIRDKYDIRLLSNGGSNKEALFMYKKNLKSYQQKKSIKDLRTRIHFTKTINSQKEGEKDKVIVVTVDSLLIGKYKNIYEANLDVSDQDVVDEATLRKYGEQYFKTTLCDVIEESIEIDVVGIPDEPVGIFDTVTVFHEKFNLDVKKKITKYTYKPMGRKLKTIGFGKIQSNLGTTLATMVDNAIEEKAETMLDAFKIQKNLSELLKSDRKGIEDKLVELEEKSKGALEVKKALFEAEGTIPDVVKAKILDAVEGDIGRLKTIITEAELIKAIQAKLNYAEIKNALIDKAFINQIISDEKFTQQFEDGQVTTQNIFTKLKDSIKSNIAKEFITKEGVRSLVNDLTIDADGIRQITQQESSKVFENKKAELKGVNSYIHKKYSDYADGRNMSDNSTLKYIGIYTGDKATAPINASEYSWTKIRGEDGRDGVDGKSINENLLPNSNFAKELENWEMARLNNSGLNWQKGHAIDNFGRGLHIWGTPNGEYKGLGTLFNLVAKQGEKLTLSMDLGKDALTQNAILYIGLHYVVNNDIVSQQWQTLDLATQNFEVRKYKRISKTFTVSADMNRCRLMIHTQNNKLVNFYIDNIKLERGEVATEWSPAYEDLRGRDGVSNYIHRKYSDSSNGANMSDNSNLKYIGIYTGTSPTPPTTASSYLWSKIKGEDGANGVPGTKGADGRTPYFHTAYANSPTGDRDFSTTNSNDKLYIGTYSDFEVADSTDYRKYKWVKIKGEDGRNGNNGRDGVSSYIYRKYSDNANGSPMSDNSNLKYIGIYTGTSAPAPTTPSAYTWSKIKGEDGQQGVPGARGSDGRTSYLHTAYANSPTGDRDFSTTNSTNKEYIGTYTDFEINDSNDYRRYKWVKIKGENGANGRNGTDGHTLTANLRLEGTYINGVTNNVKAYLDVFYDGQKISDGFNTQIKFKGGILNNWSAFWTAKVDNTGFLTNVSWGNKEQQYPIALEVIVLVTYKDLNTIANARMENIPDVVEIKEITKKYKTFESTIDRFDSTIGEVKQQVLANEEKRNLILGSRMLSESVFKKMGNSVDLTLQQEYQGLPYLSVFQYGKTSKVWQGVGFDLSLTRITKGETYSIRIPIFISESSKPDEGAYLEIKNHDTGETLWNVRLDTSIYPIGNWNTHEYRFTASKDMNISKSSFCIYHVKNGYLAFAKPYMCEGDTLPKNYSPAPEDVYLQNSRIESSIKQTKDEIDLKVSKDNVIASINASVEKNEQGQNQGIVKIRGEVIADNIHGKTFTGSKFKIGQYGFLQPIEKGLQINAPENFGSKRGIGLQIAGEGVGPKENGVPPGLFIYEDPDFTKGATIPSAVNRVLLTVAGMACFSTRVLGSVIKGQPILTNIDYSYPFSNVAPVKFIGYREGGFMHFYGTDNTNSDKWLIKVDQWGSDRKLKTDIKESEFNAIEFVDKLKFKEHGWNKDEVGYERPHTKCGLIAQELQELDESLVVDYGKYLGLDALRLINISLKAIQELSTENQQLKSQLKEMNERLQKLGDKINGNL